MALIMTGPAVGESDGAGAATVAPRPQADVKTMLAIKNTSRMPAF
jgi:hypothetical protein